MYEMNVWECMYLIMIMIPEKRLLILLLVINKITINLIWFDFDLIWCGWTEGIAYVLPSTWDVDKNAVMVFGKEAVKTGCIERLQLDQPNNKWDQDNHKSAVEQELREKLDFEFQWNGLAAL